MEAKLEERRRQMRAGLLWLVGLGISLLATHRGEFWPYSTYPMFSRAGKRWLRTVVREASGIPASERWQVHTLDSLPGAPYPLDERGVRAVELSGYLDSTSTWDPARREGLRAMFGNSLRGHKLLVYRVTPGANLYDALATPILAVDERGVELAPRVLEGNP